MSGTFYIRFLFAEIPGIFDGIGDGSLASVEEHVWCYTCLKYISSTQICVNDHKAEQSTVTLSKHENNFNQAFQLLSIISV